MTTASIHSNNLPSAFQAEDDGTMMPIERQMPDKLEDRIASFIRQQLEMALKKCHGNKSRAGQELGLSPRMMNYYMNKTGLNN